MRDHNDISGPTDRSILDTLDKVDKGAQSRGSLPKDDLKNCVDKIYAHATSRGLSDECFDRLVDIVTHSSHIDTSKNTVLIKSLIPRSKINDRSLIRIVNALGEGQSKANHPTQVRLLRWLIMVFRHLENYTTLSKLYGLIFNCLHTSNLRNLACHLLCLITRRKHVKPYRIQALMALKNVIGDEPSLLGLIQVYKSYYPDVIVGNITIRRANLFKTPDPEWTKIFLRIHETSALQSENVALQNQNLHQSDQIYPSLKTLGATESSSTLEEVRNPSSLIAKIDGLELPSQSGAVFVSTWLQQFLALRSDESMLDRLDAWLAGFLYDNVIINANARTSTQLDSILRPILEYTKFAKRLPESVVDFLETYLKQWNGKTCSDIILHLMTFLPLQPIQVLYDNYFIYLEKLLLQGDKQDRNKVVIYFASLLDNWLQQNTNTLPEEEKNGSAILFKENLDYINTVCVRVLHVSNGSLITMNTILEIFEYPTKMPVDHPLFYLRTPSDWIIYSSIFAGNALSLSRMCGILAKYKNTFVLWNQHVVDTSTGGTHTLKNYPEDYVGHFNGIIMDVCNCLWRNRAFLKEFKTEDNCHKCHLPIEVHEKLKQRVEEDQEILASLFSPSFSIVLALYSTETLRALEDKTPNLQVRHAGPVTNTSLKSVRDTGGLDLKFPDYKVKVMEDLRKLGLIGLYDLIYTLMTSFRDKVNLSRADRTGT